jgi:hypothetical protein
MRAVIFEAQKVQVEILSLAFPQPSGVCNGHRFANGERNARLALLSPIEIPVGASFMLENAEREPWRARAVGCARNPTGRFLVIGSIDG